jgi:CheY-like chemotaxis protein
MSFTEIQAELPLEPERGRQSNAAGLCILVVEDDDADAYLIERALLGNADIGGILRATDGAEALALVDSGAIEPDLALIDLQMPRKNGFHLLVDFAVRRQPCFPMVVLTSSTAPTDAMRSRLRGAIRVLTKPDSLEELEALLAATITATRTGVTLAKRRTAMPKRRVTFDNPPPASRRRGTDLSN